MQRLSIQIVAELAGVSVITMRRWVKDGLFDPPLQSGARRKHFFSSDDVETRLGVGILNDLARAKEAVAKRKLATKEIRRKKNAGKSLP